jgi:hypothetical protein
MAQKTKDKYMGLFQDLALSISSVAVITAGVSWTAKIMLNHWLNSKTEMKKLEIQNSNAIELEKIKFQNQKSIEDRKLQYAKLHEKRSEVIAQVYSNMYEVINSAANTFSLFETNNMPTKAERYKKLMNDLFDFRQLFGRSRLYFKEDLACKIDEFIKEVISVSVNFEIFVMDESNSDHRKKYEVWEDSWKKATETTLPIIKKEIEQEFRYILGLE